MQVQSLLKPKHKTLFLSIFLIGLILRTLKLIAQWNDLELPDAHNFLVIAREMTSPWDTEHREFLWIWLVKIFTWIFGDSFGALRMLSFSASLLLLPASYDLTIRILKNRTLALMVMFTIAIHPPLYGMFHGGLREDLFLVLVAVYTGLCLDRDKPINARRFWGVSVVFILTQGIRANSFVFLIPIGVLGILKYKVPARSIIFATLISVGLYSPSFIYQKEKYGDPMHVINLHARWYRNTEFLLERKISCSFCPSFEQFATEGMYSGPPVTASQYIFSRPMFEVVRNILKGIHDSHLNPYSQRTSYLLPFYNKFYFPPWLRLLLLIPILTGCLILLVLHPSYLASSFLVMNFMYFLIGTLSNLDLRLISPAILLVHVSFANGIFLIFNKTPIAIALLRKDTDV